MRPITTMYPEDPRAPFYNPQSSTMTPLAKLYIRREKVIPRPCDFDLASNEVLDDAENSEGPVRPECETTDYTPWKPCSVTCGKGIRTRSRKYINEHLAQSAQCNRQLISREMCVADIAECPENADSDDSDEDEFKGDPGTVSEDGSGIGVCETTQWSDFAPCSATCGAGISMRNRYFKNHLGIKKCPHITIVEKQKCMARECTAADIEIPDPLCPAGQWSDWSPCSVSCGRGISIRRRLLLVEPELIDLCTSRVKLNEQRSCEQAETCKWTSQDIQINCNLPIDNGQCRGSFTRYGYDDSQKACKTFEYGGCKGNLNNFLTEEECLDNCGILRRERQQSRNVCELTEWYDWSECSVSCGRGRRNSYREYVNGGNRRACPRAILTRSEVCIQPSCRR